jgi:hypothetical protein
LDKKLFFENSKKLGMAIFSPIDVAFRKFKKFEKFKLNR